MLAKSRTFCVVADAEFNKKLNKVKAGLSYKYYEVKAKMKSVSMFGITLRRLGITKRKLRDSYLYTVHIFEDENELMLWKSKAPMQAKKVINKYVKEAREPFKENVKRKSDMEINTEEFPPNRVFKGNWIQIDMNSAEPYYVSKRFPELSGVINQWYAERKFNFNSKQKLVCINGNFRNTHVSAYEWVCESLYSEMQRVARNFMNNSAGTVRVFAVRRDALILWTPWNLGDLQIEMLGGIKLGNGLGEWKVTQEEGNITTSNNILNYSTDMKFIKSKATGSHIDTNEYFKNIEFVFDVINEITINVRR